MEYIQKGWNFILSQKKSTWVIIIILGIIMKAALFPFETGDFTCFLGPWVQFIKEHGYFSALEYDFYDYTPLYIYVLVFIAKLGLNPLISIKVVSVAFEYLMAYFIGKTIRLKYDRKEIMWIMFALVPLVPTVLINSSYWPQCDSIYAAFTLGSIYFLLKKKPFLSVIFLGIAFSLKIQTVMVLPFYFVMMLRGNIRWYYFLVIPVVYFISIMPAWAAGRPLTELLTVYVAQADRYRQLTMQFPNLYIWIDNIYYDVAKNIGMLVTVLVTLISGIALSSKRLNFNLDLCVKFLFLSAIVIPFLLPGMHERYMYLGDVLGVLYIFMIQRKIYLPLGIILISTYSYIRCSRWNEMLPEQPAFFLYMLIIIFTLADFVSSLKKASLAAKSED